MTIVAVAFARPKILSAPVKLAWVFNDELQQASQYAESTLTLQSVP